MSRYYTGGGARSYDTRLRTFTERTLSEALAMVDVARLHSVQARERRSPRVLDVACGTGILLSQLLGLLPDLEAYGIDSSADMLAQAHVRLSGFPQVRLARVDVESRYLARYSADRFPGHAGPPAQRGTPAHAEPFSDTFPNARGDR